MPSAKNSATRPPLFELVPMSQPMPPPPSVVPLPQYPSLHEPLRHIAFVAQALPVGTPHLPSLEQTPSEHCDAAEHALLLARPHVEVVVSQTPLTQYFIALVELQATVPPSPEAVAPGIG